MSYQAKKTWENFFSMRKACKNNKKFSCRFDRKCLFFSKFSVWFKVKTTSKYLLSITDKYTQKQPMFVLEFLTQTNICVFCRQNICSADSLLIFKKCDFQDWSNHNINFYGHNFCLVPKSKLQIKLYYKTQKFWTWV